jgi:uncharacterized protein YecE (DUF72 family)
VRLTNTSERTPAVHVGTSGWTYDDWAGVFYPESVKRPARLAYYATQFDTLEINASFYRTPSQVMIDAWNRVLPEDYQLVLKGPRMVTHHLQMAECATALEQFFDRSLQLRTLRAILWQLPPTLAKDLPRLEQFLAALPQSVRHAVEFRHPSWWDQDVAAALSRHDAALVALSYPAMPESIWPTTDMLYVRFHGLGKKRYHYDYSAAELAVWARRLRPLLKGRTSYVFFNNGYDGHAPANAFVIRDLLLSSSP